MPGFLCSVLVGFPFLAGLAVLLVRSSRFRSLLVGATVVLLSLSSLLLDRDFPGLPETLSLTGYDRLIVAGDFLLLGVILSLAWRYRHRWLGLLASGQLFLLAWLEWFVFTGHAAPPPFYADSLSLILVRVVCLVGGMICLFAIPYMQVHEEHFKAAGTGQPGFFAVLLVFLGAMNGLLLTNDLLHFYFYFEMTTLCSFLLIRHDRTKEAERHGLTALWLNSLGGLFLLLAIWGFSGRSGATDMLRLSQTPWSSGWTVLPVGLLLLAAFTKSAQLPFQKWLLGAMVAPTPVSALLHSSTMVQAGAYLALRFAPAFAGTLLARGLTMAGGFVFFAAAVLAIGQQNAKKVLAYSTISNLGLIFACAGIGSPAAILAGILLLLFHAVSKGLLFLCIGTAEQQLHSRDIEVMRGLYQQLPLTALFAVLAMLTLILPPFGMLVGKWLVLGAGADNLAFFLLVALGSTFTGLYWVRLGGTLLGIGVPVKAFVPEKKSWLTLFPLAALAAAAVFLAFCTPWLAASIRLPGGALSRHHPVSAAAGIFLMPSNPVSLYPLLLVAALVGIWSLLAAFKAMRAKPGTPYLAGANSVVPGQFIGPQQQAVFPESGNYYLLSFLGEERLTLWVNAVACGWIAFMLTGELWR